MLAQIIFEQKSGELFRRTGYETLWKSSLYVLPLSSAISQHIGITSAFAGIPNKEKRDFRLKSHQEPYNGSHFQNSCDIAFPPSPSPAP